MFGSGRLCCTVKYVHFFYVGTTFPCMLYMNIISIGIRNSAENRFFSSVICTKIDLTITTKKKSTFVSMTFRVT